jgi:hypothetical protein
MGEFSSGKSVFVTEFEGGALTRLDTATGARTVVDLARLTPGQVGPSGLYRAAKCRSADGSHSIR